MSKNNVTKTSLIIHKRKPKLKRKSVLKMLAVMEASQNANPNKNETQQQSPAGGGVSGAPPTPDNNANAQEFLSSGRTGRRNALPDILGQHAAVTSSDLPSRLQQLTTKDKTDQDNKPSTSSSSKS